MIFFGAIVLGTELPVMDLWIASVCCRHVLQHNKKKKLQKQENNNKKSMIENLWSEM